MYTHVDYGSNLSTIAEDYYGSAEYVDLLAEYNGIDNPNLIFPKQKISLPQLRELVGEEEYQKNRGKYQEHQRVSEENYASAAGFGYGTMPAPKQDRDTMAEAGLILNMPFDGFSEYYTFDFYLGKSMTKNGNDESGGKAIGIEFKTNINPFRGNFNMSVRVMAGGEASVKKEVGDASLKGEIRTFTAEAGFGLVNGGMTAKAIAYGVGIGGSASKDNVTISAKYLVGILGGKITITPYELKLAGGTYMGGSLRIGYDALKMNEQFNKR